MGHTEVNLLLYICAAICFLLFALNVQSSRVHLLGLGVLFWSLVPLIDTAIKLSGS